MWFIGHFWLQQNLQRKSCYSDIHLLHHYVWIFHYFMPENNLFQSNSYPEKCKFNDEYKFITTPSSKN